MAIPRWCMAAAMIIAIPAHALAITTTNLMKVTPTEPGQFIVSGVPYNVPWDYWCTAGQYAQSVLGLPASARLYVVGDREIGRRYVTFSIRPDGTAAAQREIKEVSVWIDGANMRVDRARAECKRRIRDKFP